MASGEAVQDALDLTPCLLAQPDEVDTLIRAISADNGGGSAGGRFLRLSATLMEFYTSADSIYACRRLAHAANGRRRQEKPRVIDQPHLVIYSAATPEAFFGSLSEQLISRGFLSRCIILDTPERGDGQQATALEVTPASIIERARAWYEWQGTEGNLVGEHPIPALAAVTDEAQSIIDACRRDCDKRYGEATGPGGKPVWSRCAALAEQLALVYACSVGTPPALVEIDGEAADWGVRVSTHLAKRLLWHVSRHVGDGEFAKAQLKFMRTLEDRGGEASERDLKRALRSLRPREFDDVVRALVAQERIEQGMIAGRRKQVFGYRRTS
jgi:hypothetical protein